MEKFSNHIHGDKFVDICEYAIRENDSPIDINQFDKNKLVFCKTDQIPKLFEMLKDNPNKFVLVSHNSDHNITPELYSKKPKCIDTWFAQNVLVLADDLVPIPIGMERPGIAGSGDITVLEKTFRSSTKNIIHFAYLNVSPGTNPTERDKAVQVLSNKDWVKHETNRLPFETYIRELHHSKFVIAPPGNGHDTHRLWEALYMDAIPVVKNSAANKFFSTFFEMLVIDNWEEVTKERLEEYLRSPKMYGFHNAPLSFNFWKRMILDTVKERL
jgi:hypothetical protein